MYMGLHLPLREKKVIIQCIQEYFTHIRIYKGGKHKHSYLPDLSSMSSDALHPEGSIRREFCSSDWFLICIICT